VVITCLGCSSRFFCNRNDVESLHCMCPGAESARKTSRHGEAPKAKSVSKEVEDELASMRGTQDTERIMYMERKELHGVSNVEEKLRKGTKSSGSRNKEDNSELSSSRSSRDSSPARPLAKKHTVVKSLAVADRGISFFLNFHPRFTTYVIAIHRCHRQTDGWTDRWQDGNAHLLVTKYRCFGYCVVMLCFETVVETVLYCEFAVVYISLFRTRPSIFCECFDSFGS